LYSLEIVYRLKLAVKLIVGVLPGSIGIAKKVLVTAIALSLLVGLLRYFIVGAEYYSIFRVVIELLVPAVLIYLLLLIFKLQNRFAQTLAAVAGSGAIIYAFALPVFPSFHASADESQYGWSVYIIILLDLWSVAVLAFILKHAGWKVSLHRICPCGKSISSLPKLRCHRFDFTHDVLRHLHILMLIGN